MFTERKNKKKRAFELLGGGIVTGESPKDLATELRETSFSPCETIKEFMEDVARRAKIYSGATISTYNAEQFVVDLAFNGFLEEIDLPPEVEYEKKPNNIIPFPEQQSSKENA